LAYALDYQALDRTLTDKEVEQAHTRIESQLRTRLSAKIRGKDIA
jgi:phenylalanyl-tRNA synthetase beta subunit